jgi:hypothetical protein
MARAALIRKNDISRVARDTHGNGPLCALCALWFRQLWFRQFAVQAVVVQAVQATLVHAALTDHAVRLEREGRARKSPVFGVRTTGCV